MSPSDCPIQQLITLRHQERAEAKAAHLREVVGQVEKQLGERVMAALGATSDEAWNYQEDSARRTFRFEDDAFVLTVYTESELFNVARIEARVDAADIRDNDCIKRFDISEINEDWFLDTLQNLCKEADIIRRR